MFTYRYWVIGRPTGAMRVVMRRGFAKIDGKRANHLVRRGFRATAECKAAWWYDSCARRCRPVAPPKKARMGLGGRAASSRRAGVPHGRAASKDGRTLRG